jgi:hypothetical protein
VDFFSFSAFDCRSPSLDVRDERPAFRGWIEAEAYCGDDARDCGQVTPVNLTS